MVVWDLGNHLKLKSMPDSFHDSDREMSPGTVTVTVMCNGLKSYLEEYSCFWLLTCHFTYCKVANSTTFCLVTPVDLFNKSLQNAPIWGPSRACVQAGPASYHVINSNARTWDCGSRFCKSKIGDSRIFASDFFHFDLSHFRYLLRPKYEPQRPQWGLKF